VHFGAHVSTRGGIDTAVDRIVTIGGDCLQVFTQSPRMWRATAHDPDVLARFRAKRASAGIGGVLCHASYLCNFAAPNDAIYEKSVLSLATTLEVGSAIGADGVVFHVGSHLGAGFEHGLERAAAALSVVLDRCRDDTWLLMENSAGAGGTMGRSLAELQALLERLDRHPRLGVCLDSCHLYASGYDVTDRRVVDGLVREIEGTVGLDRLRALHVNDSGAALGSNRDRHANILEGAMGDGIGAFLAHPALQHLASYLEVPGRENRGPDALEIEKLRDVHARWTAPKKRRRAKPT
jgi:deoxyribonuclease IV